MFYIFLDREGLKFFVIDYGVVCVPVGAVVARQNTLSNSAGCVIVFLWQGWGVLLLILVVI